MRAAKAAITDPVWRRRVLTLSVVGPLTLVPLIGSLGYEHAFVLSPVFSLLATAAGVDALRAARQAERTRTELGRALGLELMTLHGLAVGTTLLGALWQRGCDPLGGLAFYAMGPGVASALGAVAGLWGALLGRSRAAALGLAVVPMGLCTLVGLHRLYADPVVFAFDPFFGYFSGAIYDEGVQITDRYLLYRGYTVLAGTSATLAWMLATTPKAQRRTDILRPSSLAQHPKLVVSSLATLIASLAIGTQASRFGFTADEASLRKVLPLRTETEHFIIDYAPRTATARTIEQVAAEHEFAYSRLRRLMGGREPAEKVHSFVFRDREQKRRAMGAGAVQIAAPWRSHIYLDQRPFPHPVLHHELAHIFGKTVGDPVFGIARRGLRVNVGLIEGFATGLAPRAFDRLDLHDQVEVLVALGRRPALVDIMGPGFFAQNSRAAYTAAGSFVLWLIETRGFEPMAVLYRSGGDTQAAYGESLATLEAQWLAFLRRRNGVRPADIEAQAQRFRRGSVFERPCAHKVAALREELRRATAQAAFDEAVDVHQQLCALEPMQPLHKLELAVGYAQRRDIDAALETLDEAAAMPDLTVSVLSRLHELRGDLHLFAGQRAAAASSYREGLAQAGLESRVRTLELKLEATQTRELARLGVDYFGLFNTDGDGLTQSLTRLAASSRLRDAPDHAALGSYLVALQLINMQKPDVAVGYLEQAYAAREALPSDAFRRAMRTLLMNASLQVGDYPRARTMLDELRSEPGIGNGHRLRAAYWSERIEFFEVERPLAVQPDASARD